MKKIVAISLISLTLFACKKEKKTITKIDPTTGDTIKIEAASEEDSIKIVKEMASKAAIKDSAGVYTQGLKLEKGKTYPFTTFQKQNVTLTAPTGEKQSMSQESTDEVTFTVNDFKNGMYDMTINFVSKKTTQSAEGKSISIDTKKAAPTDKAQKQQWSIDKALTGNQLKMQMTEKGEIKSITGFEAIYSKISNTINSLTKDANERKFFNEQTKAGFNEEILKDQFSKNIFVFPKKGAKIGEKWTVTENSEMNKDVAISTHYTLKKIENGVAEISITGGIPKKSNKATQEGITRTLSSELSQNGILKFDVNSGWIINQNIKVTTEQKETLSDGKQSQSMTNVTQSNVIVNP